MQQKKEDTPIKRMADLLRQGATLTDLSCPVCASPLFRLKDGTLWCEQDQKKVIIVKVQQALGVLGEVSEDSTTPRNIRRAAKDAMDALQSPEFTPAVKASNAVSLLDEILQDPNMPPYTRVKLWNVMSFIEAIKD